MPDHVAQAFGGGVASTVMNPIVLAAMVVSILLLLLLPRKYAIFAFLPCIFLVPLGQQLYLGGMHWMVCRLMVMAGLMRLLGTKVFSKKPLLAGGFNPVDGAFLACILFQAVSTVLLYMKSEALVNQFGFLIDSLGAYFLLRFLIHDDDDVYRALKCLAVITAILAIGMVREQLSLQNVFGLLGGVRIVPEIREGKIRSQGVFQHSILAGVFAATLIPLFVMLWKNGKSKILAAVGLLGASVMTYTSQSSTPLLAYVAGLLGISLWGLRKKMRNVRWGIVIAILLLAIVMKAPVWFIIAHIDLTGGSSGYHRAELVDQFIRHFGDWWLIGTKDASTWGWDMWDVQNQYVDTGETGGIAAFVLFIAMISRAFARIGNARRAADGNKERERYFWFLGSALFANCLAFIGANYFDQTKISWFLLLAIISAATVPILQTQSEKAKVGGVGLAKTGFEYSWPPAPRAIARNVGYKGRGASKIPVR
jgi:hypothetical protein